MDESIKSAIVDLKSGDLENSKKKLLNLLKKELKRFDLSVVLGILGEVYLVLGDYKNSILYLKRSLEIRSDFPEALNTLGLSYKKDKQLYKSIQAFKKAIQNKFNYSVAHRNLGLVYKELEQFNDAADSYRLAIKYSDGYSEACNDLANVLRYQGKIDEATSLYKDAIRLNKNNTVAYRNLFTLFKVNNKSEYLLSAEKAYKSLKEEEDLVNIEFALGKAYKDLEIFDKSFTFYKKANKRKYNLLSRKPTNYDKEFEEIIFLHQQFESFKKVTSNKELLPIFIIGLPRSGSTLVESILSMNGDISSLGEVDHLNEAIYSTVLLKTNNKAGALRKKYIDLVGGTRSFTDKMLFNFKFCGIILNSFPEARILHTYRNPLDNIFSLFTTYFSNELEWTFSLDEIERYYDFYKKVMEYWERQFPSKIYHLEYDSLVKSPETEIYNLIKFCNLRWDNKYLSPHNSSRNILTASSYQARQPINTSSVGFSKNYENNFFKIKESMIEKGYKLD
ncbi:MAG: sulfotransferase [SAR86 cluster bacterium]|nr:sulfotransferase [SAR86 cluster bacterium]